MPVLGSKGAGITTREDREATTTKEGSGITQEGVPLELRRIHMEEILMEIKEEMDTGGEIEDNINTW